MKTRPEIDPRWRWHHQALLAMRRRLTHWHDENRLNFSLADGDDLGDRAERETGRDLALAELRTEEGELAEIDAALQRLRDGTYGICLRTGRPISAARLRAMPWTPYSRDAARQLERFVRSQS